MYHDEIYEFGSEHPLYDYSCITMHNFKNMYNVTNYFIRNTMTGLHKSPEERYHNETEVLHFVFTSIPKLWEIQKKSYGKKVSRIMNDDTLTEEEKAEQVCKLKMPKLASYPTEKEWMLFYQTLDGIMKVTNNADYYSLPSQVNQQAIKKCVDAWVGIFESKKSHKKNASSFTGRPGLPKYRKQDKMTAVFPNQVCKISEDGVISFPKTKEKFQARPLPEGTKLVEIRLKPYYGFSRYTSSMTMV